jgi:Cu+-exporting ATPase
MSVKAILTVRDMNCASCVSHVEKAARKVAGVLSCDVSLPTGRASVQFDPALTNPDAVAAAITESGYPAAPAEQEHADHPHDDAAGGWFRRTVAGLILWLPVESIHWIMELSHAHGHMEAMVFASLITSTLAIIYVGRGFYRSAWSALRRGTSNMDTLIALGASVAYGYSLIALLGKLIGWWPAPAAYYFMESSGLLALISLGHWLEARARHAAGSAIRELMTLAPSTAMKLNDSGKAVEVPLSEIVAGDRLLVRPGDRVPTDGIVIDGSSSVDESMMSGEPIPPLRKAGDPVIGGTLNLDGRLVVKATRIGAETALAQMVQLVESAQASKPPVQKLADQIAAVFVPTVLAIAVVTGVAWFLFGHIQNWPAGATWAALANAVCSVLIIACPCALGLALPAALMVGTGLGARRGILIRDIDALQHAASVRTVVLDKTGTLTSGKIVVAEIRPMNGTSVDEVLALAAAAELSSSHPLAKAIVAAANDRNLKLPPVERFSSEPGYGIAASIGGRELLVGNDRLLARHGWNGMVDEQNVVFVAEKANGRINELGLLQFTDSIKPDSAAAVTELKALGLRIVLLTGDHPTAANAVAKAVGINEVMARMTPEEKAAKVQALRKEGPVAMVGDGINDAPALAAADLGIAIGSGSDIAKEAGGIVLVSGSLMGVADAIQLSRATMRTIHRNLFFAFLYNVLAIPLAAFGLLNPLIAAGAMALSDVTVIGSALMLRRALPKHTSNYSPEPRQAAHSGVAVPAADV